MNKIPQEEILSSDNQSRRRTLMARILSIAFGLFAFLLGLNLMSHAFGLLGKEAVESIIFATSNPFIALFIGLLMTAVIQSSSTSTSMIVAAVASGSISLPDAVPMIMGANIGTTLTSTIVSLGFITKKNVFRKAIAAGTVHDFFNILIVLVLFPLEHYYGFLSTLSQNIVDWTMAPDAKSENVGSGFRLFEFIRIKEAISSFIGNNFILLILSFLLLFASIKVLSTLISKVIIGESRSMLTQYIFRSPFKSFLWGTAITGAVQSSSVITSLVVPLVATGKVKLEKSFPFIMGANIGTTITAFIAALFNSKAAMGIAVTHLLINFIGVVIFLPFPSIRNIPINIASQFGKLTMNTRIVGFAYIVCTFFVLPFTLIYLNKGKQQVKELTYQTYDIHKGQTGKQTVLVRDLSNRKNKRDFFSLHEFEPQALLDEQSNNQIITTYQKGSVLFINNQFYLLNKQGFCWDGENKEGKFQVCITKIINNYPLTDSISVDSVYVYTKNFYLPELVDSISYKYFIYPQERLLVSTERLNKLGEILYQKKLMKIKTL